MNDDQIGLFELCSLEQIRSECDTASAELIDFSVGYDGCVYLLFSSRPSARIENRAGSFVDTRADSRYTAAALSVDWERQKLLSIEAYELGLLHFNYHFLKPLNGDFLLLGARCHYRGDGSEKNGLIISRDGSLRKRLCFGDGIQDCITQEDGSIITSYFDEGVFGNYGWDDPIGSSGIIVWERDGTIRWKNTKYDICDCYAVSTDSQGNLYFYYYTDFELVKTDFKRDETFSPGLAGSSAFAVSQSQTRFLFSGGYRDRSFYLLKNRGNGSLTKPAKADIRVNGRRVQIQACSLQRFQLLFLTNDGMLCGYDFI